MRTRWQKVRHSPWWQIIWLAWARWREADGGQHAAAFSYYLLLSILPLTILLVSVGSLFVDQEVVTRALVDLANRHTVLSAEQEGDTVEMIQEMLEARGAISLVALPLVIWGSLKFLRTLIRTTNRIWQSPAYNWFRLPLKSLGLLGVTVSALFIGILLPGWFHLIESSLTSHLKVPDWAFGLFSRPIPWIVLFYGLLMIYRMAPSRPTKFSEIWLGALCATVMIRLCERFFLIYVANFAQFNVLYGTLGGIVMFLLWLYLASCLGVFGICICVAQRQMRGQQEPGEGLTS